MHKLVLSCEFICRCSVVSWPGTGGYDVATVAAVTTELIELLSEYSREYLDP
jgi:hypothetical protein